MGLTTELGGPWTIEKDRNRPEDNLAIVSADGKRQICAVLGNKESANAIARLVRAAPEIYDALADARTLVEARKRIYAMLPDMKGIAK